MAAWDEQMFTRVPDGWTFNAAPLMLGRPRLYLLDDAQKAAVLARLRGRRWAAFAALVAVATVAVLAYVAILAALGVPLHAALMTGSPLAWVGFAGAVLVALGALFAATPVVTRRTLAPLAPVLAGARRIDAPPAPAERPSPLVFPVVSRLWLAALFAVLAAAAAWDGLGGGRGKLLLAAALGLGALMQVVRWLLARRRMG